VVLERVEVTRFRAQADRDLRHLAGCAGVIGGELAALLGLAVAAAPRGEDDRAGVDLLLAAACAPAVLGRLEACERALGEGGAAARLPGLAQRGGDRVAGAVADLEQALAGRAAAAGDPVPPVRLPASRVRRSAPRSPGGAGSRLDSTSLISDEARLLSAAWLPGT
jgi:hypothetical protein